MNTLNDMIGWLIPTLIVVLDVLIAIYMSLVHRRIRDLERRLEEAERPRELMQAVINETSVSVWNGEV